MAAASAKSFFQTYTVQPEGQKLPLLGSPLPPWTQLLCNKIAREHWLGCHKWWTPALNSMYVQCERNMAVSDSSLTCSSTAQQHTLTLRMFAARGQCGLSHAVSSAWQEQGSLF